MQGVYGNNRLEDALRIGRAIATNQLARFMPGAYVRLTGETGRGRATVAPEATATYFLSCVHEYMDVLGVPRGEVANFWKDKRVVEYGPGDIPGVALLLIGLGASSVVCVDRFPLVRFDDYQQRVIEELAELVPENACRERLYACFQVRGKPASGLAIQPIRYHVSESGLLGMDAVADLVISRAVLEHVNDLAATFVDIARALRPQGRAIHKVDLKSHGLHRCNRLDFLTWPERVWDLMFSHKGAPNRIRVNLYRELAPRAGLSIELLEYCEEAATQEVHQIRPFLAPAFRGLSDEELACLSFWMVCHLGSDESPAAGGKR